MLGIMQKIKNAKVVAIAAISVLLLTSLFFLISNWRYIDISPLYTDLTPSDRSTVINKLSSLGIDYEIYEGNILVDSDIVRKTRMFLAAEGIPSSGSIVGYEIFNKSEALGTSSFAQNVNLLRSLEGELSRTIMSFESIQNARVHLVIPKRELFNRKINKPKASVILKMHTGSSLVNKQVAAIMHLVASAVQGLSTEDITIVGTDGQPFKLPDDIQHGFISSSMYEYKLDMEKRLQTSIENLLSKFVGHDKVKAEVNVELNLEHLTIESEVFNPDSQVARSTQSIEESSTRTDGKTYSVSVSNNIPNVDSSSDASADSSSDTKSEEITNYEISRDIIKRKKELGDIKKLSIAVLVDGNYAYDDNTKEYIYMPHNTEAIEKLHALISSAVGLNAERGDVLEVVNMQFSNNKYESIDLDKEFWTSDKIYETIKLAVILLILSLISLFLVRPILKKLLNKNKKSAQDGNSINPNQSGINAEVKEEEAVSITKKVNDIISESPEKATSMLRNWMKENNA